MHIVAGAAGHVALPVQRISTRNRKRGPYAARMAYLYRLWMARGGTQFFLGINQQVGVLRSHIVACQVATGACSRAHMLLCRIDGSMQTHGCAQQECSQCTGYPETFQARVAHGDPTFAVSPEPGRGRGRPNRSVPARWLWRPPFRGNGFAAD